CLPACVAKKGLAMAVILVVDDDTAILKVMAKTAGLRGHRAVLATTASASLEAAILSRPQLTIIDWRLPDRDGIALLREFHRQLPPIIGIVLRGYPTEFSRSLSPQAGAADYIEKPFHPLALLSRADELLAATSHITLQTTGPSCHTQRVDSRRRLFASLLIRG